MTAFDYVPPKARLLNAETISELSNHMDSIHNVAMSDKLQQQDFAILREICTGLDNVLNDIQGSSAYIAEIGFVENSDFLGEYNSNTRMILFDKRLFNNYRKQAYGTGVHEAIHAVQEMFAAGARKGSSELIDTLYKQLEIGTRQLARQDETLYKILGFTLWKYKNDPIEVVAYACEKAYTDKGNAVIETLMALLKEKVR
jgi:hypothetical protein